MQVKKFEAPTIQEALETIKRELGPEAIILHTKQNKKGFGLMNKGSVEVTAAVSERAAQKKRFADTRMPEPSRNAVAKLPADRQADAYERYLEKHLAQKARQAQDRVEVSPRVANAANRASAMMPMGEMGMSAAEALATRPITRTPYVEIDDDAPRAPTPSARRQPSTAAIADTARRVIGQPSQAVSGPNTANLVDEVENLKRMLQDIQAEKGDVGAGLGGTLFTPALKECYDQLTLAGLERRNALEILKRAGFELGSERSADASLVEEQVAHELFESISTLGPIGQIEPRAQTGSTNPPLVVALVGPTGVGKTTTLAKIASEALLKRGLKVGLVNLDSYKVAALDQLATYAKILNVPFRSASSVEDLKAAIHDFKALDLVLVDTTGRSQKDPAALKEMESILHSVPNLQTQLVLSATTRDAELYDMAHRFSIFLPQGLIFSKLDEATTFGSVYNTSQKAKLPLLYFTTGQRVPEDLEEATRERLVALLLGL